MKKEENRERKYCEKYVRGKEFAGSGKEEKREQSSLRSSKNNSESAPGIFLKRIIILFGFLVKKFFTFCLIVVIVAAGFGYLYRDQVKTVLPNELVEFFTAGPK